LRCASARAAETLSTYARSRQANASGSTPVDVADSQARPLKLGEPARKLTYDFETQVRERGHRQHDDGGDDHQERDRSARQILLSQYEQRQRNHAEREHRQIRVRKLTAENREPLEKALSAALHAEKLRELRERDRQGRARLEAQQNGFADEIDERAETQQPRDNAHHGDEQGRQRCYGCPASRVAFGHAGDGQADEHRDRRSGADRELARRPEERVEQPADEVAVDAVLRRQPGKRSVRERNRNAVSSEGNAGHHVLR
jgi:hypothetical protein